MPTTGPTRSTRQSQSLNQPTSRSSTPGRPRREVAAQSYTSESNQQPPELEPQSEDTVTSEMMEVDPPGQDECQDDFVWTPEAEVVFYKALLKYKPLGINKNFNMLAAAHELKNFLGKPHLNAKILWKHLSERYCLEDLEKLEKPSCPIGEKMDFELPVTKDFKNLVKAKAIVIEEEISDDEPGFSDPVAKKPKVHPKRSSSKAAGSI